MSFRKKLIKEAFIQLREEGITQVCTDLLKGVSETEIKENFEELLNSVIDDTIYWEQGY